MKELVYEVEIVDRQHLLTRINEASLTIKEELRLDVTTTEIRKRARECRMY